MYYCRPNVNIWSVGNNEAKDVCYRALEWLTERYLQLNIWKIIYLNCGERYDFMIDHSSYTHNLSSCEIKAWKKFRPERDSIPWPLRCRCICSCRLSVLSHVLRWRHEKPDPDPTMLGHGAQEVITLNACRKAGILSIVIICSLK